MLKRFFAALRMTKANPLVTLSAAKGLDSMLKRFFAALRMTEGDAGGRYRGGAAKTSEVLETLAICRAAVDRAGRYHLRPMRCLNRSLALLWMLRRRGIATALRLGCRRQGEAHDFHAWVVDGEAKPLVDSPEQGAFVPLQPPNP
jgi:hypothetical protein